MNLNILFSENKYINLNSVPLIICFNEKKLRSTQQRHLVIFFVDLSFDYNGRLHIFYTHFTLW